MSGLYCALVHHPVRDREGAEVTTSVTNLDVHDIARAARTYGLRGYFVVTPITAQHALVERIVDHWRSGAGAWRVPERGEALSLVRVLHSVAAARAEVAAREGVEPRVVGTAARRPAGVEIRSFGDLAVELAESAVPHLILFGTGHGMTAELLATCDVVLEPIRGDSDYNHLSVRAAAAIVLDRLVSGGAGR